MKPRMIDAIVCATIAILAIVLLVWITGALPATQQNRQQHQYTNCVDRNMRDGEDSTGADLRCAYITRGF